MIDSFFTQNHSTVNKYRQNFQGPAMFWIWPSFPYYSYTIPNPESLEVWDSKYGSRLP